MTDEEFYNTSEEQATVLKEEHELLKEECKRIADLFRKELELEVPKNLDSSASKEECLSGALNLWKKQEEITARLSDDRKSLRSRYTLLLEQAKALLDAVDGPSRKRKKRDQEFYPLYEIREAMERILWVYDWDTEYHQAIGSQDDARVQILIQDMMMKGRRSQEIRDYVLTEHCPVLKSFVKKKKERQQRVQIDEKVKRVPSNALLTPELASMVFSHCSLETCVQLRQVDVSWYTAFQTCEEVLETKMKQRSPWMKPGGDVYSWADCVLVFVKRLSKWKKMKSTSADMLMEREQSALKNVVARELHHGEKIPGDFVGLEPGCSDTCSKTRETSLCDKMHLDSFTFDPKTLEFQDSPISTASNHVTRTWEGDDYVINCKQGQVTLPQSFVLREVYARMNHKEIHESEKPKVKAHKDYLSASYYDLDQRKPVIFVVPREKPHYKYGFDGTNENRGGFQLGDFFVTENTKNQFNFYQNQALLAHPKLGVPAVPVAIHQGLIWWALRGSTLFATFVDLETPDQMYTNKPWNVQLPDISNWYYYTSTGTSIRDCKDGNRLTMDDSRLFHQYDRYLTRKHHDHGLEVIDLNERRCWHIQRRQLTYDGWSNNDGLRQWPKNNPRFYLGFVKDKFQVFYLHEKTVEGYRGGG